MYFVDQEQIPLYIFIISSKQLFKLKSRFECMGNCKG